MDTTKCPRLYEFLVEAELLQYYSQLRNELKVQNVMHLKYVTEDDLYSLGMSKPEIRRLKKYFNKYCPQNYLAKFKKLLTKKNDGTNSSNMNLYESDEFMLKDSHSYGETETTGNSGSAPHRVPNKHIISVENIVVNKELGMGEFGVVQQGVWTNDGDRIQVAIKCLSRERMQNNPIEFLKEAAIMHSIDHEHVVRLYGVVLNTDSLMLVTELAPLRSLLECLKEPSLRSSFTVLTLCDFSAQICDGMQYLEAKRLIHRDLAARNILVFSKNKVKISDFGLSRALGQGKDYYQTNFNVHLKLPIAWCAPECISYLRFTSASDVWAFGVTLWEMFSYGFQPWAALTGQQILEAIDEPNYQRLEQPECCPRDYYTLMLQCWAHDPSKRPRFSDIAKLLPDLKPEQVQAIRDYLITPTQAQIENNFLTESNTISPAPISLKKDYLQYKTSDLITVLDKNTNTTYWKGVLSNGKTGLFNPTHTVAFIGANLPTSQKPQDLGSTSTFSRSSLKYNSSQRRKLRSEMISLPQGDFKHTGHVGLDGVYFGDLAFLGGNSSNNSTSYNHLPRQIVTPYRPHEDLDQTPLLQNGNSNAAPINQISSTPPATSLHQSDHIQLSQRQIQMLTGNDYNSGHRRNERNSRSDSVSTQSTQLMRDDDRSQNDHEYHEISDEENLVTDSPRFEKTFDFGRSLLDEMESMFNTLTTADKTTTSSSTLTSQIPTTPTDHEGTNKSNELKELTNKFSNTLSMGTHRKKQAIVKPISSHDEKILETAIELANSLTAKSLNDINSNQPLVTTPNSPNTHKFKFRFPTSGVGCGGGGTNSDADSLKHERRNFSDEAQSIPDLQETLTPDAQIAYESLIEAPMPSGSGDTNPLHLLRSGQFPLIKSRSSCDKKRNKKIRSKHSSGVFRVNSKKLNENERKNKKVKDVVDSIDNDDVFYSSTTTEPLTTFSQNFRKTSSVSEESCNGDLLSESQQVIPPSYKEFTTMTILEEKEKAAKQNALPLPPKTLQLTTSTQVKPRHTRKHPLIIPASTLKRTLNKVNATNLDFSANSVKIITDESLLSPTTIEKQSQLAKSNNIFFPSTQVEHHYENQEMFTKSKTDEFDVHSVNFEEQIEMFADEKPPIKTFVDEVDNFTSHSTKKSKHPKKSETEEDIILKYKTDHVSCEDLLEFADAKPSSRARGIESDEVRIMSKVLGTQITADKCLLALEYSNWDVHRAIKLAKLQSILKITLSEENPFVDLSTCKSALENTQWNLSKAASYIVHINNQNQNDDVTQV